MKLADAIDLYFEDMWGEGRITSASTERDYRIVLHAHRRRRWEPRPAIHRTGTTSTKPCGAGDTRTLGARTASVLVAFYRWVMQEGYRNDNPAEQTRPPKRVPPDTRGLRTRRSFTS